MTSRPRRAARVRAAPPRRRGHLRLHDHGRCGAWARPWPTTPPGARSSAGSALRRARCG